MKNEIKEYPKTFQEVFFPLSEISLSKINRGIKAKNISGNTPISGQEKANINPLKTERNILLILF
jgi:hypothetical protein